MILQLFIELTVYMCLILYAVFVTYLEYISHFRQLFSVKFILDENSFDRKYNFSYHLIRWTTVLIDEKEAAEHTIEISMSPNDFDKKFTIMAFGYTEKKREKTLSGLREEAAFFYFSGSSPFLRWGQPGQLQGLFFPFRISSSMRTICFLSCFIFFYIGNPTHPFISY